MFLFVESILGKGTKNNCALLGGIKNGSIMLKILKILLESGRNKALLSRKKI